jgi:hypothetical protein
MFKIQKKERVYAAASLAFGPFRRSAHFCLSFTPTETGPLRSAFWPGTSAPTFGFHRHRRPSNRAVVPCIADCRPPPRVKSQTEAPSCRLHFPHWIGVVPSPLPPLTPSKTMRSKTPPPPAASPPPHRLPGPIKCTPASPSSHRTRCSPPSLFYGLCTQSTCFSCWKKILFPTNFENFTPRPRVLFKLQTSPRFQILFNI